MKTLMKELMKSGVLSKQTYFNYIGINWDKEKKIIAKEQEEEKISKVPAPMKKKEPAAPGGADLGGDMGMGGGGMGGGEAAAPGETPPAPEAPGGIEGMGGPGEEGIA